MINWRLMAWCVAAAVLTPTVVHAQHGKAAVPRTDLDITVSAKDEQAGKAGRDGKDEGAGKAGKDDGETAQRASARTRAASKREPASEARSSRLSTSRSSRESARHGDEEEPVAKAEADETQGTPAKSAKTTRTARASRSDASESAGDRDPHETEQVARVTPGSSGKSVRTLEVAMERINEQVEAIRATAPAKPRPVAPREKPAPVAHKVVKVAAAPTEAPPPRMRLTWRTVLEWPVELRGDEETPEQADVPRVTLSWP